MKVVSIVGARPQFIKAAPLSRVLRRRHQEYLIHTGQHYDDNMSRVFFDELEISRPDVNLGVGSSSHARQTGEMMVGIEKVVEQENPDVVLVYGDTNSTIAGALAAIKQHVPVAHVEAGLRSWNWDMPEEINRVLTDRISRYLFCPTQTAVENLAKEGITKGVHLVGDVMVDALMHFSKIAERKVDPLNRLGLEEKSYCLATLHRPVNTDNSLNLNQIIRAFLDSGETIVFPVHPRTQKFLQQLPNIRSLLTNSRVKVIDPVSYLEILILERHSKKILTDSGGIQKEAYIWGVPCITLREETEWVETVQLGWNILVGADHDRILKAIRDFEPSTERTFSYGDGRACEKIVSILEEDFKK